MKKQGQSTSAISETAYRVQFVLQCLTCVVYVIGLAMAIHYLRA